MSILIKGMEMPKSCTLCELLKNDRSAFYCPVQSKEANLKANLLIELYANCPLIELPPHGDLIDRDAVLKMVQKAKEDDTALADVYQEDYIAVRDWLAVATVVVESEDGDG